MSDFDQHYADMKGDVHPETIRKILSLVLSTEWQCTDTLAANLATIGDARPALKKAGWGLPGSYIQCLKSWEEVETRKHSNKRQYRWKLD